jgi:hypothetical protein
VRWFQSFASFVYLIIRNVKRFFSYTFLFSVSLLGLLVLTAPEAEAQMLPMRRERPKGYARSGHSRTKPSRNKKYNAKQNKKDYKDAARRQNGMRTRNGTRKNNPAKVFKVCR